MIFFLKYYTCNKLRDIFFELTNQRARFLTNMVTAWIRRKYGRVGVLVWYFIDTVLWLVVDTPGQTWRETQQSSANWTRNRNTVDRSRSSLQSSLWVDKEIIRRWRGSEEGALTMRTTDYTCSSYRLMPITLSGLTGRALTHHIDGWRFLSALWPGSTWKEIITMEWRIVPVDHRHESNRIGRIGKHVWMWSGIKYFAALQS